MSLVGLLGTQYVTACTGHQYRGGWGGARVGGCTGWVYRGRYTRVAQVP